jgi:hypothetical protein
MSLYSKRLSLTSCASRSERQRFRRIYKRRRGLSSPRQSLSPQPSSVCLEANPGSRQESR